MSEDKEDKKEKVKTKLYKSIQQLKKLNGDKIATVLIDINNESIELAELAERGEIDNQKFYYWIYKGKRYFEKREECFFWLFKMNEKEWRKKIEEAMGYSYIAGLESKDKAGFRKFKRKYLNDLDLENKTAILEKDYRLFVDSIVWEVESDKQA